MRRNCLFSLGAFFVAAVFVLPRSRAQISTDGPDIMLQDAQGRVSSLGAGFNPVPISDHKFLVIRGAEMGYGEESGCERPAAKNRVVVYDTSTNKESLLFDQPLSVPMMAPLATCSYEHVDLSPSESTLYIVIPCYATAGCLAIIDLPTGAVRYVLGAMDVFVVRGGSNAGELIYMKRLLSKATKDDPGHPYYPYVRARPDGSQIAIISSEDLVLVGGNAPAPILRAYLRSIQGRIFVQGEWVP